MTPSGFNIEEFCLWNERSAEMLYDNYYKALTSYAFQFVNDYEVARDTVQEVFSKLWEFKRQFNNETALKVYLYNAVRNSCLNNLKYVKKDHKRLDDLKNVYGEWMLKEDTTETVFTEEIYRLLLEAINAMPEGQRKVFLLAIQGKKNKEISKILNVSQMTVKTHKKRGMATLREKLHPTLWLLAISLLN